MKVTFRGKSADTHYDPRDFTIPLIAVHTELGGRAGVARAPAPI